jgi:hypothetical protein
MTATAFGDRGSGHHLRGPGLRDPSPLAWGIFEGRRRRVHEGSRLRGGAWHAYLRRSAQGGQFIISGESGAITLGAFYSLMTEPKAEELAIPWDRA